MTEHSIILLLLLISAFCLVLMLHIIENKKTAANLQKNYDYELVKKINRFNWSRSIQLFSVMGFSFLLIALYDWQLKNMQEQLQTTQNNKLINTIADGNNTPKQPTENYYPPTVVDNEPLEQSAIQDIFETKTNIYDHSSTIDNIKKRYEELFVTYFFLHKCNKTSESDYQSLSSALQNEMNMAHAPTNLQEDIITAANGSYEGLYSRTDCSDSILEPIFTQYRAYLDSLTVKDEKPTAN